ncbi:MAG: thioredoxin family protein [Blautia sp.]|nr:thioredoxin family protein [Blautia sp.]
MKKISKNQILTLGLILALSVPAPAACALLQYNTDKTMKELTLEQLTARIEMNAARPQYLYIGRDDCPDCQKVLPELTELNREKHLQILSYSTSRDRDSRPEQMYEVLNHLQVDSVPTVLVLEAGEVTERYSGEEFLALYE